MYSPHSKRKCSNFKSVDGIFQEHSVDGLPDCKNCVYFTSLNCGNDVNDTFDSLIDFFC